MNIYRRLLSVIFMLLICAAWFWAGWAWCERSAKPTTAKHTPVIEWRGANDGRRLKPTGVSNVRLNDEDETTLRRMIKERKAFDKAMRSNKIPVLP